jgi:hypothetical protein
MAIKSLCSFHTALTNWSVIGTNSGVLYIYDHSINVCSSIYSNQTLNAIQCVTALKYHDSALIAFTDDKGKIIEIMLTHDGKAKSVYISNRKLYWISMVSGLLL